MDAETIRGRMLVEESREAVVVLDDSDRVVAASRRARQAIEDLREGQPLPPDLLTGARGLVPYEVPYEIDGRHERLVYLSREGDLAAYEELRSGFTAAVSHELRTPLARLLTLLETAALPGEDVTSLVELARAEVDRITELIDEVMFLSELESGARVVALEKPSEIGRGQGDFQRYVQAMKERGILLAACSKNEEEIARSGLTHPDTLLSLQDFTAFKANWE